jgi:hypothetical protein
MKHHEILVSFKPAAAQMGVVLVRDKPRSGASPEALPKMDLAEYPRQMSCTSRIVLPSPS